MHAWNESFLNHWQIYSLYCIFGGKMWLDKTMHIIRAELVSLSYQWLAQFSLSKCRRQVACCIVEAISERSSLICPVCPATGAPYKTLDSFTRKQQRVADRHLSSTVSKHWLNYLVSRAWNQFITFITLHQVAKYYSQKQAYLFCAGLNRVQ